MKTIIIISLIILSGSCCMIFANNTDADSFDNGIFEWFPIAVYDTDIGFGGGVFLSYLNLFGQEESFKNILFASTKGERWIKFEFSLPDVELRQGRSYPWAIDILLDYDLMINNSYFGLADNSSDERREYYTKEPFEIKSQFSRGFDSNNTLKIGMKYRTVLNKNIGDSSKLVEHFSPLSVSRATVSSIMLNYKYDRKDSFINPTNGFSGETEIEWAINSLISNVSFFRYLIEFQAYYPIIKDLTIASRLRYENLNQVNLPVQYLLSLGGNSSIRAYPQDRFLCNSAILGNLEVRFPIYWRIGGIAGYDLGMPNPNDLFSGIIYSNPAIGLRYYAQTFVVRFDIGFTETSSGIYFNFNHIF